MIKVEQPVALVCVFTWIGFVCAISFLEAWLKFRAPGVTLPIGLGIGRLVFSVLNKVEWVFAIVVAVSMVMSKSPIVSWQNGLLAAVLVILITQTTWLLPGLDARAQLHIDGKTVAPSNLHLYYVGAEVLKVSSLIVTGINLFEK
jgi:hypothetical protein